LRLFVAPIYLAIVLAGIMVVVNVITFDYPGVCPSTLARAEFQKDKLFSLLEGEQGHLGTEIRDVVLAIEDQVCPLLGL